MWPTALPDEPEKSLDAIKSGQPAGKLLAWCKQCTKELQKLARKNPIDGLGDLVSCLKLIEESVAALYLLHETGWEPSLMYIGEKAGEVMLNIYQNGYR